MALDAGQCLSCESFWIRYIYRYVHESMSNHPHSEEHLAKTLRVFGGPHINCHDTPPSYMAMVSNCDIPENYEPGRFHTLEGSIYVILHSFVMVIFSGLHQHGGTSPI